MNHLFVGNIGSGKTTNVKKFLSGLKGKKIVFDFNDEYTEISPNQYYLDKVNPILGKIGLLDAKAINAGYLHDGSRLLYTQCRQILKETEEYKALKKEFEFDMESEEFESRFNAIEKEGLIESAIDRLLAEWGPTEVAYGKELNSKIQLKRNKTQIQIEKVLEDIEEFDLVLLKSKSMHSDHLRAAAFSLLSKLSRTANEPIWIVADELTSLFNQGNTKMFLETIDMSKLRFVFAFNKLSSVPPTILPLVQHYYLHEFSNKTDIEALQDMGVKTKKDLRKLKKGEYCEYSTEEESRNHTYEVQA